MGSREIMMLETLINVWIIGFFAFFIVGIVLMHVYAGDGEKKWGAIFILTSFLWFLWVFFLVFKSIKILTKKPS
jgi:hypothetical protein